jgi:NAD(P)-dependent dehydrogenase (short-subunit alcohol dehydrogenase family)
VRLENKVALISGGASGIGAETARLVVREGGKAVIADRDADKGRALAEELGVAASFVALDVTDEAAWQKAVAATVETYGGLHGLLNAAGVGVRNTIEDCSLEDYRRVNDINSLGTFLGCKTAIPAMKRAGGGSIVNMGSTSWMVGQGGMAAYTAAKSAVLGLTRSLARDWGPDNIRVNSVAPGWIMTERQQKMWLTPEGERELMARQCLKRKLYPDDIARVVLFMAADDSGAMTNQSYIVDGGWV